MNDICPFPWVFYSVWPKAISSCCHRMVQTFDLFDGCWKDGGDWNSQALVEDRSRMLELGKSKLCEGIKCPAKNPAFDLLGTIGCNLKKTDEVKSRLAAACDAINKKETCLSYQPIVFNFQWGYRCNASCPMCFMGTDKSLQKVDFPRDKISRVIESAKECLEYRVVGGELFCLPDRDVEFLLSPVNRNKSSTLVYTNASLLTVDKYKRFVEDGPVNNLVVSIDTVDQEKYGLMRGLDFSKTRRNLVDIKSKYSNDRMQLILAVICSWSYDGALDLVKFAKDVGIKNVQFQILAPYNVKNTNLSFVDICGDGYTTEIHEKFKRIVSETKEYAVKNNVGISGIDDCLLFMDQEKARRGL